MAADPRLPRRAAARLDHQHLVAVFDFTWLEHSGIEPRLARMSSLQHAGEVPFGEPSCILGARSRVRGDFDLHSIANPKPSPRSQILPIKPGDGQVLAGIAGIDGMPFVLKPADHIDRVEAESSVRAPMMRGVLLFVSDHAVLIDRRAWYRSLRHPAVRGVDPVDAGHSRSVGRPRTLGTSVRFTG